MNKEEIINTLKEHYSRDVRKQLVKSMIANEKLDDKVAIDQQYKIMNQIFSYVLKECNWTMSENSTQWDNQPLEIMTAVFPKLATSQWYQEQSKLTTQDINIVMNQ